ncbi:MAG: SIS domain-containing protein [Clostridiales bacterium]|jgi:D-arabinose 5-phosphate isomerase GutQ|nr:SIS domain-containing protein [Clostridiales bacterium]
MTRGEIKAEAARVLRAEADALRAVADSMDMDAVASAVEMLAGCPGKIALCACGTSAMAARKIAHTMNCVERPAFFMIPSDAVHGGLGALCEGDVLVLVSKGGDTKELAALIPACRSKGAKIIAVSENAGSLIARNADLFLQVRAGREPCPFGMLATASSLAAIAVFDAISVALMGYTGYTRERFARIHPAGAVGERLLKAGEIGGETVG